MKLITQEVRKWCLPRVMKWSNKPSVTWYFAFSHGARGIIGLILITDDDMIKKVADILSPVAPLQAGVSLSGHTKIGP